MLPLVLIVLLGISSRVTASRELLASKADLVELSFMHWNDVHNRVQPQNSGSGFCPAANEEAGKCFGGYARIRAAVREARARDPDTIVLDAGDEFTGTTFDTIWKGNVTSALESLYGVDVMTLGNHEFDFGPQTLATFMERVNFPIVGGCNIDASAEPSVAKFLKKYVILKVKGVKIAVYGVLTNETQFTSSPGPNIKFSDPATGLAKCILEAKCEHSDIDLHIALTHIGYEADKVLASQVKGVDLIIGAHSHSFLWNKESGLPPLLVASNNMSSDESVIEGPYPTIVTGANGKKKVPIVTAYWSSRYVGSFSIVVNKRNGGIVAGSFVGAPILLGGSQSGNNVEPDAVVSDLVKFYSDVVVDFVSQEIGETLVDLDNTPSRRSESLLGDLSCNAFMNQTMLGAEGVDFCIVNGGGMRASILKGIISFGSVTTTYPFSNTIAIISMTGGDVMLALEWGVSAVGTTAGTGRFPQVGGLKYAYDSSKPVGSRIVSLMTSSGTAIDPCKMYSVVTNNYMAGGGDGYSMMASSTSLLEFGAPLEDVFASYIELVTPVNITLDGRIVTCQLTPDDAACSGEGTMSVVASTLAPAGSVLPYILTNTAMCP